MPDLLIEIGVEEIPAGYAQGALGWLAAALSSGLHEQGLTAQPATVETASSPRRLALHCAGLQAMRAPESTLKEGPRRSACFDGEGQPTRALLGFARSAGVDADAIVFRESEKKGEVATVTVTTPGRPAGEIIREVLDGMLARVPFPKSMHWAGKDARFCRPVRSLVVLLDEDVVPMHFADVESGRLVHGHPFLAPGPAELEDADLSRYRTALQELCVLPTGAEREQRIRADIEALDEASGLATEVEPGLLAEVANLVEWPGAQLGAFDEMFLELPEEVIIEPMKIQQRYFPVREREGGKLTNRFVVVHNRGGIERPEIIVAGNERVLRARLADARFFYENDTSAPLERMLPRLQGVVYRRGQGNLLQKARRLEELSGTIVRRLLGGEGREAPLEARATFRATSSGYEHFDQARRAGLLAKADLASEVVFEFPRLQGTMGRIYAERGGESASVAAAIGLHHGPRPDDPLPEDAVVLAVALADKLDNLVSATLAGALATGSRDPYATRRDALAVIRMIHDGELDLDLVGLLQEAAIGLSGTMHELLTAGDGGLSTDDPVSRHLEELGRWTSGGGKLSELTEFMRERLLVGLRERGHDHELVAAVLETTGVTDLLGAKRRLEALGELAQGASWAALVEAVERTGNITRDFQGESVPYEGSGAEPAEESLATAVQGLRESFDLAVARQRYVEASDLFVKALSAPLAEFFSSVFVNCEDQKLRASRLSLLRDIHRMYSSQIADLSRISVRRGRGD